MIPKNAITMMKSSLFRSPEYRDREIGAPARENEWLQVILNKRFGLQPSEQKATHGRQYVQGHFSSELTEGGHNKLPQFQDAQLLHSDKWVKKFQPLRRFHVLWPSGPRNTTLADIELFHARGEGGKLRAKLRHRRDLPVGAAARDSQLQLSSASR